MMHYHLLPIEAQVLLGSPVCCWMLVQDAFMCFLLYKTHAGRDVSKKGSNSRKL